MFREFLSKSDESSAISGMKLSSVWHVDADSSYVIKPAADKGLVAIRTLSGTGSILYKDGRIIEPDPNSLLFIEFGNLKEYRCKGDLWQFWGFEFKVYGIVDFPLDRLLTLPLIPHEIKRLNQIFTALQSHDSAYSKFATAAFCHLFYEYGLQYHTEQHEESYQDAIAEVIRLMNEQLESPMSVPEMASKANMSERNFRKVFKKKTGRSPKDFYTDIRMEHAFSLLRQGYSVEKVAYLLGFSDPFYFSNAFNKHFGFRPSTASNTHNKII